jgi:hypothetical protein
MDRQSAGNLPILEVNLLRWERDVFNFGAGFYP